MFRYLVLSAVLFLGGCATTQVVIRVDDAVSEKPKVALEVRLVAEK